MRSRREFLEKSAHGFGAIALSFLMQSELGADPDPLAPKPPHFAAKAKNVIFLFMQGGPSHLDTFDPKPELARFDGQTVPPSFRAEGLNLQNLNAAESKLMAPRRTFRRYGRSGIEISDLFPNLARHADELAVIRSCYHESFIHGPAFLVMNTGQLRMGYPSLGSWILYGLGAESRELPAYVVMADTALRSSKTLFGPGFLPAVYQGTMVRSEGALFENLAAPAVLSAREQQVLLEKVGHWNRQHLQTREEDTRLAARIRSYELAFRMQAAAPELMDLSRESEATRRLYGFDDKRTERYGRMCLMARRLVERGVRFVQLYNGEWDGHNECEQNHEKNAWSCDRPIAGLLEDLKSRGLLETTLVIWAGEFGRTPVMQGSRGRDHSPYGFSIWMAGGGVRGGKVIGATDEFGFRAVENRVHPNDLHATVLSLVGLDHLKLTYHFQGRDFRATDVGGLNNLAPALTRG